jgi:hypothetical protein
MILKYLALCSLWGSVWGNDNFKAFANLEAMEGYSVVPVASGLDGTRTLVVDRSNGDLITVARGIKQIVALWETGPFSGQFERAVLVDASAAAPSLNLSHGLALRGNYIYASSDVNIWRWPYKTGERKTVNLDARETIVFNMVL